MLKQIFATLAVAISLNTSCLATEISESTSSENKNEFAPGDTLQSPTSLFTIIEKLGEGAFGQVYSVENESGEKFAIKYYKHPASENFDSKHPFNDAQREFERGQMLDHPNILKSVAIFTHTFSEEKEDLILVLELVDGKPLFKIKRSTFTQQEVVDAILKLVDALKYAMAYDLFHLDLHSGNVMIDSQSDPKVIDLASFFDFKDLVVSLPTKSETLERKENETVPPATAKRLAPKRKAPNNVVQAPPKHPKVAKFLNDHPQIARELRKRVEAEKGKNAAKANPRFHKSLKSHSKTAQEATENPSESLRAPLCAYYFNMISDICADMVYLSELDKDQKINLHAEIKKLSWSYDYDIKEGDTPDFDHYVNSLTNLLLNTSPQN